MSTIFVYFILTVLCFMALFCVFNAVDLTMNHRLSNKLNKMFDRKFGD